MNDFLNSQHQQLYNELSRKIDTIEKEKQDILDMAEACSIVCRSYVEMLRAKVKELGFENKQAEINFFKYTKPRFACLFIYYIRLFHFHKDMPEGVFMVVKDYVTEEFNRITRFFEENKEFYFYYRQQHFHFDEKYFLTGEPDLRVFADSYVVQSDPQFSTSHDFLCSEILANKRMLEYLKKYIGEMEGPGYLTYEQTGEELPKLNWTETDAAMSELIYALKHSGAINNGNASIKDISAVFRKTFNWSTGNVYDHFQHLKIRKNKPAKFLQKLIDTFLKKLDEGYD